MEDEEDTIGCMSCMSTNDLCDLFAVYAENVETYAKMFETCFDIKVADDLKYVCVTCAQKLEDAVSFKEQTIKSMTMLQGNNDEEYLDEILLAEDEVSKGAAEEKSSGKNVNFNVESIVIDDSQEDDQHPEDSTCIYCDLKFPNRGAMKTHIRGVHGIRPRIEVCDRLQCELCTSVFHSEDARAEHARRCHGVVKSGEGDGKRFQCHFCDNVYSGRKACYTHVRMKHGLKLSSESGPKAVRRERKYCHICRKDFSQKQLLNKHLWKEHGYEVEKRKAYVCPMCDVRVSYGNHFERHLLTEHRLKQKVVTMHFKNMDEFTLYKSQIQEETKCRFRKTTASKPTIEGLRSHYMCSQSGMYVYQGKGIRPAPERQIYKSGKACPAHMIVTETVDRVLLTFYMTHVGHGACPYYEPREPKKPKLEVCCRPTNTVTSQDEIIKIEDNDDQGPENENGLICDSCGLAALCNEQFRAHSVCPCTPRVPVFQNIEVWSQHFRNGHKAQSICMNNNKREY